MPAAVEMWLIIGGALGVIVGILLLYHKVTTWYGKLTLLGKILLIISLIPFILGILVDAIIVLLIISIGRIAVWLKPKLTKPEPLDKP